MLFCIFFQTIFQYIFNRLMRDLAEQIATTQCFRIEFENVGLNRLMSVKFWKGDSLCRVFVCRSGLPSTDLTAELSSLSRLFSVVSTRSRHRRLFWLSCGANQNHNDLFSRAVQSCFRFEHLGLETMMRKPTYSVFGRIDFFSVLKCLMVSLGAATGEDWVLQSPDLAQVRILCSPIRQSCQEIGKLEC